LLYVEKLGEGKSGELLM